LKQKDEEAKTGKKISWQKDRQPETGKTICVAEIPEKKIVVHPFESAGKFFGKFRVAKEWTLRYDANKSWQRLLTKHNICFVHSVFSLGWD
jgi:hypothetical protein